MGKISKTHLRGTIGNGGPTLKLITVNGSITLHDANDETEMNPDTHVHGHRAPRAPPARRATRVRVAPPPERP